MSDKSILLYNDEVKVTFKEGGHRYTVTDPQVNGGEPFRPPSVTTILRQAAKPALVWWASNCAADYVASVWEPGVAYEADYIAKAVEEARYAHTRKATAGKEFGTFGHDYMESFVKHQMGLAELMPPPTDEESKFACEQMVGWLNENVGHYIGCEMLLYSRKLQIVGLADLLAEFTNGDLVLSDYKYTSGIWNEYRFQIAAYAKFYEECYGKLPVQRIVPWWDKKEKKFKPTPLPQSELEKDFEAFKAFITVHHRAKELECDIKPRKKRK